MLYTFIPIYFAYSFVMTKKNIKFIVILLKFVMKEKSKAFKVLLTIFIFGFVIWLGGTIFRTTIAYNLFTIGSNGMFLKPEYSNIERLTNIYLFSTTSLLTGIAYGLAACCSIVLAINTRKDFKRRGWLFMAFVLFLITVPIQVYFFYMDFQLAQAVYYDGIRDFNHPSIQKYFVERYIDVKNASMRAILLLAAFTSMLYAIWRPLDNEQLATN